MAPARSGSQRDRPASPSQDAAGTRGSESRGPIRVQAAQWAWLQCGLHIPKARLHPISVPHPWPLRSQLPKVSSGTTSWRAGGPQSPPHSQALPCFSKEGLLLLRRRDDWRPPQRRGGRTTHGAGWITVWPPRSSGDRTANKGTRRPPLVCADNRG